MRFDIKMDNELLENTARRTVSLDARIFRQFGDAAWEAHEKLESVVRAAIPVDTGNLRRSLKSYRRPRRLATGQTVQNASVAVGIWNPVAVFVEYGTVHQPAQMFFRLAIRRAENAVQQAIVASVRRQLRELAVL